VAARAKIENDIRLTPAGKLAALQEVAAELKPELAKLTEGLRSEFEGTQRQIPRMTEAAFKRPDEIGDGASPAEVRAWILALPERDRADKVDALIRKGDALVLRSVLAAPPWLLGIDPQQIEYYREDAVRGVDPERFRKIQALRKGLQAAEKAIDGLRRFLHHDVTEAGARERVLNARLGIRRVS
jgi:hypothetical protein